MSSVSFHDRAGDGQPHTRPLWFRRMKGIKNQIRTLRRQPYAGIADGDAEVTLDVHAGSDRQLSSGVLHGLDRIQHQVHEDLLQLHPVCHDVRHVCLNLGANRYGVTGRFGSKQSSYFLNGAFDVNRLAFSRCARFVEGAQTVDDVGRAVFPPAQSWRLLRALFRGPADHGQAIANTRWRL